jgi:tetratricopeptide (TPR) repeat protein
MSEEKLPAEENREKNVDSTNPAVEDSRLSSDMPLAISEGAPKSEFDADLKVPLLIDEELTKLLVERGAKDYPASITTKILWIMAFGLPAGLASALFGYSFIASIFGMLFIGWLAGTLMARQVTIAMQNRHYAKVTRLLPRTLFWTTMWFPYTYNSHMAASDAFVRLLMLEGRFVEFQAVSLYSWGLIEPYAYKRRKSPKNWGVANNLAVALLSQWRFEEAAEVFRDLLKRPADKRAEAILLNNLALCLIKCGKIEEADVALTESRKKTSSQVLQFIGWRHDYIRAAIETEKGNLQEAEESIETAREKGIRYKDNLECQPRCDALMAKIRAKQGRMEEAELFYRNTIDALAGTNNPSYIALAAYTMEFAEFLDAQGKTEMALAQRDKALAYRDLNLTNELLAVEAIKDRLQSKKPIIIPMGLCNLSHRDVYVEAIPDFAKPAQEDLLGLLETEPDIDTVSKTEDSDSESKS